MLLDFYFYYMVEHQCGKKYILGNRRNWKNKNMSVKCLVFHPRNSDLPLNLRQLVFASDQPVLC